MNKYLVMGYILVLSIIVNCIGAHHNFYPLHDTMNVFGLFHYFYSNFFFNHTLAQWTPYDYYGQPTYFAQLVSISPMSALMMLLGKCLAIRDTLLLFKWTMIAETFIFGAGMWQLGCLLFKHRLTTIIVVTASILSIFWLTQPFFNFRLSYLVPWMLVMVIRCIDTRQMYFAWMSVLVLLLACLGNLVYFVGIWFWGLIAVALLLILVERAGWRDIVSKLLKDQQKSWVITAVVIVTAGIFYIFLKGLTQGVDLVAPDREANAHSTITRFLSYGGQESFIDWLKALVGYPVFLGGLYDLTIYAGMWVLPMMIVAIIINHHARALVFYVVAVLLAMIIFIPVVAGVFYLLPMISYFRHIGHLLPLLKILMIIGAGFGVDGLKSRYPDFFNRWGWVIVVLIVGDCMFFQYRANQELLQRKDITPANSHIFDVHSPAFQDTRSRLPMTERQQQALTIVESSAVSGGRYTMDYNFIQWDPCNSSWRKDWMSSGIRRIADVKHSMLEVVGGCESEKLWLAPNAQQMSEADNLNLYKRFVYLIDEMAARDPLQAMSTLKTMGQQLQQGIFINEEVVPSILGSFVESGKISVNSFSANHLEALVTVGDPKGQWLYYADSYHPGWKAYIDSQHVKVVRANVGFKAVHIPHGEHRVKFVFADGLQSIVSHLLLLIAFVGSIGLILLSIRGFRIVER